MVSTLLCWQDLDRHTQINSCQNTPKKLPLWKFTLWQNTFSHADTQTDKVKIPCLRVQRGKKYLCWRCLCLLLLLLKLFLEELDLMLCRVRSSCSSMSQHRGSEDGRAQQKRRVRALWLRWWEIRLGHFYELSWSAFFKYLQSVTSHHMISQTVHKGYYPPTPTLIFVWYNGFCVTVFNHRSMLLFHAWES